MKPMPVSLKQSAFIAAVIGGVVVGCAADDDEAPVTQTPAPQPTTTTPAERLPEPATCANVTRSGPLVTYRVVGTDAPPPIGGEIVPGNYELQEVVVFDPTKGPERDEDDPNQPDFVPDARIAQKNVVMAKDHLRFAAGDGASNGGFVKETLSAAWYKVDGTNINLQGICPTRANLSIPYSASPNQVILFTEPGVAEFYSLR